MSVIDSPRRSDAEFTDFVKRQERILRNVVSCNLRDTLDDVDDALQDGLLKVWRKFESMPKDQETRARYASQIVSHASLDLTRHKWGRWGHRRTSETFIDFTKLERDETDVKELDATERKIIHLIAVVDEALGGDEDTGEFDRRLAALTEMLPALKSIERDVLLERHPAAGDRDLIEVSKRLKITHGQARQHYMEAMAVLRPLLAHALAPSLDPQEAGRVLDYAAGVMTDKRERGRMKRHLRHCEACRGLADGQQAVIAAGAKLMLPMPALVGLAHAAAGSTAVGAAAVAGSGGGGGAAVAGGGVVSGLTAKVITGAAALSVAASGYTAVEHKPAHHAHHARRARQVAVVPSASPTAAPTQVAPTATASAPSPTAAPTQAPRDTPTPTPTHAANDGSASELSEPPQSTPNPEPVATIASEPPPIRPGKSSTTTSESFDREFSP